MKKTKNWFSKKELNQIPFPKGTPSKIPVPATEFAKEILQTINSDSLAPSNKEWNLERADVMIDTIEDQCRKVLGKKPLYE